MVQKVKAIPEGKHSISPYLVTRGADRAIEFYKKAFGAKELNRMPGPDGKVMHAEIRIGDSVVMLSDEFAQMKYSTPQAGVTPLQQLMLYVEDVDAVFNQAIAAGARSLMPPEDMFWGDRYGKLVDPFGHQWALATHKEDLSPAEIKNRQDQFFAGMAGKQ